jgi:hypothetical protein
MGTAYDGGALVYGGYYWDGGATPFDYSDVWSWDGVQWTKQRLSGPMPARDNGSAGTAAGNVVVFGGQSYQPLGETWLYNGSWSQLQETAHTPRARIGPAGASLNNVFYIFGGQYTAGDGGNVQLNDLWQWDGTSWTNITPRGGSPSARSGAAMVA